MSLARVVAIGACTATLLLAACGDRAGSGALNPGEARPAGQQDGVALSACQGLSSFVAAYGAVQLISGAFSASAGDVVRWQETRHGPNGPRPVSRFRDLPASDRLYVCYFDGKFAKITMNVDPANPYDRVVVIVDESGAATLDHAGYKSVDPVVDPSR